MLRTAGQSLAAMMFRAFQAHSEGRWQFHIVVAVSSLRAIPVPLDLYDVWNRLIDDLEEPDSITARPQEEHPQDLSLLRPDAWPSGPSLGVIGRCSCWN